MILRDYMVYVGVRSSRRITKLNWFQRDLFMGVLHTCDDYGRFEADAEKLRSALYGLELAKVGKRDVQDGLMRMGASDVGLVKFYTVRGVGYGKVHNYRQRGMKKRRALYPDEDGQTPEPELFSPDPAASSPPEERKKEEKSPLTPRPAGGCDSHGFSDQSAEPAEAKNAKAPQPRRERRMPSIIAMTEELAAVEAEMQDILRPGGCAYNVTPSGDKAIRFERLGKQRTELLDMLKRARGARADRDAKDGLGADAA